MREIKFRAWLSGINKMTYSHTLEELMNWDTKKEDNGTATWLQYTGLKDKNGKEIYEGDILHTHKGNFVVTWDKYMFVLPSYYCGSNDVPYDYFSGQSEDEVIGNIYENPDLSK